MRSNSDNPRVGREFQERICVLVQEYFKKNFVLEKPIPIGEPPNLHRFDCASADGEIVVECKSYTWTNTGNVPSAKLMGLNQAVLYMSYLPAGTKRIIAISRSLLPHKTESLAEYYYRINGHLLKGIEIIEVDDDGSIRWINP